MKTKLTLLVLAVALLTLSFTFTSLKDTKKTTTPTNSSQEEPIGALASEDKI
jgi:hypothetical protein